MNRKRLLTILAGATAAMALQMGPAAALDLGVAKVDTSDGLSVEADIELGDEDSGIKLDPKIKVGSKDEGTKVEGGAKVGDAEVDAGEATKPVQDAVNEATGSDSKNDSTSGGSSGGSSSDEKSSSGSTGGSTGSSGSDSSNGEVTTASRTQSFAVDSSTPNEAMSRLSGYEFSPSSAPAGQGYSANVTPAFDLSEFDPDAEVQEPLIAAPQRDLDGNVRSSDGEVPAPEAAAPPRADAELATSPLDDGTGAVPAGLKLLAAALVAGSGAVWHVARREVGLR